MARSSNAPCPQLLTVLIHLVRTKRCMFRGLEKSSRDRKRLRIPENPPLNRIYSSTIDNKLLMYSNNILKYALGKKMALRVPFNPMLFVPACRSFDI
jgi:hypothetical protein